MNLNRRSLEFWLKTPPDSAYPTGEKPIYYERYTVLAEYLSKQIHDWVGVGLLLSDPATGLLTWHGQHHVQKVIFRAGELASTESCELNAYEVYLLLSAIQVHDAGNILGRTRHEEQCREILDEAFNRRTFDDSIEKELICSIASAHGGIVKDKIGNLPPLERQFDNKIRIQMLAALLKFSDELAEDHTRAATFLLKRKRVPRENQLFHEYCLSLRNVEIDATGGTVVLKYDVEQQQALSKFKKGKRSIYLLDEIFHRNMKTHLERIYCMRFLRPYISIDKLSIIITIWTTGFKKKLETIRYPLLESGYPDPPYKTIHQLCPNELMDGENRKWDGAILKKKITNAIRKG